MIFLLDSNAISDLIQNHPRFVARMESVSATDEVRTASIVRGEILYGVSRLADGKRKTILTTKVSEVFAILRCESVTELTATYYAKIRADQEKSGLSVDQNDLWIAAVAMSVDATVISRDTDLVRVAGLKVVDWTGL